MSRRKLGFAALSFALCFGAAHAAFAQTCSTDQDCPVGLACVVSGNVSDVKPLGANDLPASTGSGATGGGATGGGTTGSGTTGSGTTGSGTISGGEIKTCEPKACTSVADCAAGMLCHKQERTACSGGAAVAPCEKGTTCPSPLPPSEPVCTTSVTSVCVFPWQLPCNIEADCGQGFACQPSTIGSCGSSSGTGNASGSAGVGGGAGTTGISRESSTAPDDGNGTVCTTTSVYPGSCQPKSVSCEQNADCPATWTCQEVTTGFARDTSGTGAGAVNGTSKSTKICVSPYGGYGSGAATSKGDSTGPGQGATGGTTGGTLDGDRHGEAPITAPVAAEDASHTSGGCAFATPTGSSALVGGASSLLLLALTFRRRRR